MALAIKSLRCTSTLLFWLNTAKQVFVAFYIHRTPDIMKMWFTFLSLSCKLIKSAYKNQMLHCLSSRFYFPFTFTYWPEGTEILFSFSAWSQWCNNNLEERSSFEGFAGGLGKVVPFFQGQAEACRRLMEEEISAENSIHTLFSQDRARHSLQPHLAINIQQALAKTTYDDMYWVIWKRWYHA